ncbi:MAG: aldehyde reductase [Rhizobiaceae bacterium]|nr:aldehyde reductase [Rhizobiaceae bacterium]
MAGLVLVTGGSGFLGAHCIARLLEDGYSVRTTVRSPEREADVKQMLARAGVNCELLQFHIADLRSDDGWQGALQGCSYVLHVASPFPERQPSNPDDLIIPARDGTLRVLRAARDGGIKRVVLTSSFAAIGYGRLAKANPYTEEDWTDEGADVTPYVKSKTIAERAAWHFVEKDGGSMELSVINPVGIFGPLMGPDYPASIAFLKSMLEGKLFALPRLMFGAVDVRDVAQLHVSAMIAPDAAGQRFLATSGDFLTVQEIAQTLKTGLGSAASRVSTRTLPDWLVRMAGVFSTTARQAGGADLGRFKNASNEKARRMLSWQPRSPDEAIVAAGKSLLDLGLVKS